MSESEIRQLVRDYREHLIPLDRLESRLLDIDIPEETDLSRQLVGLLAEASHAHWPEEDIRMELASAVGPFAKSVSVDLGMDLVRVVQGQDAPDVRTRLARQRNAKLGAEFWSVRNLPPESDSSNFTPTPGPSVTAQM